MSKTTNSIKKIFNLSSIGPKPRKKSQLWMKDVGFDEAPWYRERMGLRELEDFLEVADNRIDHVKITTLQVLGHPKEWLERKIKLYKKHSIQPYLDHGYFLKAFKKGKVNEAIDAAADLGFSAMEFMNTFGDIPENQIKDWCNRAIKNGMNIIYEHHPESGWRKTKKNIPTTLKQITESADRFFDYGAFAMLIDHEEIELHDSMSEVLVGVLEHYGKSVVAFEVTSPKEAETRWYSDVLNYFKLFGSDCNLTNIMPSQVMLIDLLRSGERPANILFDRFPELTSVKDK